MKRLKHLVFRYLKDLAIEVNYRAQFSRSKLSENPGDVVVCMTSYPERIDHAWLAIESLFRQTYKDFHIVLVLARDQFPGEKLPRMIRRQIKKGLKILWQSHDRGSFDHLWPAVVEFPDSRVISVDDDKFFPTDLVEQLVAVSESRPGTVIGARGWAMASRDGVIQFQGGWERANPATPPDKLFMPPGNGSLYPPASLPALTGDDAARLRLCPTADDVWYWAMASLASTPSFCLGMAAHRPIWKQSRTKSLADLDAGKGQFHRMLYQSEFSERLREG